MKGSSGFKSKVRLEGVTLEMILTQLVNHFGWEGFARHIKLNCFSNDPSIKSSLTFLRRTPWARNKVEELYLKFLDQKLPKK